MSRMTLCELYEGKVCSRYPKCNCMGVPPLDAQDDCKFPDSCLAPHCECLIVDETQTEVKDKRNMANKNCPNVTDNECVNDRCYCDERDRHGPVNKFGCAYVDCACSSPCYEKVITDVTEEDKNDYNA